MKWNKETIISLIIVILFVGSIFGMAVGSNSRSNNTNNTDTNTTPTNPDENKPTEFYTAYIDTNVTSIYPQLVVVGQTSEFDQSTIDATFKKIDGVKKNTISFQKGNDGNIITMIKVLIDAEKKNNVISEIKKVEFLTSPEIYQSAILSMPKEVVSLSGDENKTKEYQFTETKLDGMISSSTETGDELKAQIQIVFKGETPTRFLAIEVQNLTSSPQLMNIEKKLSILEWMPEIRIFATSPITKDFDENKLKEIVGDINSNPGRSIEGALELNLMGNKNISDINTYLTSIKDQNESIISNLIIDENSATLEFSLELNADKYALLKNKLNEHGIDENKIKAEPKNIYRINFNKEGIDVNLMKTKISNSGLIYKNAEKNAIFDVSSIEYQGKIITYDQKTSTAWLLYPEDLNNTEINIMIQGYYSRNKFWFIQLNEKRE